MISRMYAITLCYPSLPGYIFSYCPFLFNNSRWQIHLLSPIHIEKGPLNLYVGIVALLKARPKLMSTFIFIHPRNIPVLIASLIAPLSPRLTHSTNQKHKCLIEACFLPIFNPSVKLLENQLNSVALFYVK